MLLCWFHLTYKTMHMTVRCTMSSMLTKWKEVGSPSQRWWCGCVAVQQEGGPGAWGRVPAPQNENQLPSHHQGCLQGVFVLSLFSITLSYQEQLLALYILSGSVVTEEIIHVSVQNIKTIIKMVKVLNKHNITHIMYVKTENVTSNLTKS